MQNLIKLQRELAVDFGDLIVESKLGIKVVNDVQTNMVYIDFSPISWTAEDWNKACADMGWKSRGYGTGTRLVTHYGIEEEDIKGFLDGIAKKI